MRLTEERRTKVYDEVNRPTFTRLSLPMTDVCRFVSIRALRECVAEAGNVVRYIRPECLDNIAETREIWDE